VTAARFRVERIPLERLPTLELTRALRRRNPMYGLVEVDVTVPRQRIRAHRERTGEQGSFTAFLIACLARAVGEHPTIAAFRSGRRLVVFDHVDVATMVEVTTEGARFPLPHVVRDAEHKTVRTIHDEIRGVQQGTALLHHTRALLRPLPYIPKPVRVLLWRVLAHSVRLRQRLGGTVLVTSVGAFIGGPGWGLAPVAHPVTLMVGGLARRPVLRDGALEEREHLCLTLVLDHEVVDGAPAARFGMRLRELIAAGAGLEWLEQEEDE
jgi:pyruvate/2-oxoglutarate dehydrogenase complex dihydrolipoamide acyltransferase (E2) component